MFFHRWRSVNTKYYVRPMCNNKDNIVTMGKLVVITHTVLRPFANIYRYLYDIKFNIIDVLNYTRTHIIIICRMPNSFLFLYIALSMYNISKSNTESQYKCSQAECLQISICQVHT